LGSIPSGVVHGTKAVPRAQYPWLSVGELSIGQLAR
jgi:hypothetical protein